MTKWKILVVLLTILFFLLWHKIYWSYFHAVYLLFLFKISYCHCCLLLFSCVRISFSSTFDPYNFVIILYIRWLIAAKSNIYSHEKYNNLWWFKACKQHIWTSSVLTYICMYALHIYIYIRHMRESADVINLEKRLTIPNPISFEW